MIMKYSAPQNKHTHNKHFLHNKHNLFPKWKCAYLKNCLGLNSIVIFKKCYFPVGLYSFASKKSTRYPKNIFSARKKFLQVINKKSNSIT